MATITQLTKSKTLELLPPTTFLDPDEQPRRLIYMSKKASKWLTNDLPDVEQSHYFDGTLTPMQQAFGLFNEYIKGGDFNGLQEPHIMKPDKRNIWVLRTHDLRMYGWFYKVGIFIMNSCSSKHEVEAKKLYSKHVVDCFDYRKQLDLDKPKSVSGDLDYVLQL